MAETGVASGLVAAAGRGRRMGAGHNKVFLPIAGVPLLAWTLHALSASPLIGPLAVIVGAGEEDHAAAVAAAAGIDCTVVTGGETRADSVRAGLEVCADLGPEWVAIHDGARPFVDDALIERAVGLAMERGAGAAAVAVSDTIKRVVAGELVVETPSRTDLRAMQTPQVFRLAEIRKAYRRVGGAAAAMTDDCQVAESAGIAVYLAEGAPVNLKITHDIDRTVAEAIAAGREKPELQDPTGIWPLPPRP